MTWTADLYAEAEAREREPFFDVLVDGARSARIFLSSHERDRHGHRWWLTIPPAGGGYGFKRRNARLADAVAEWRSLYADAVVTFPLLGEAGVPEAESRFKPGE